MNLNHKNYPKPHAQQGVTLGPQELPLGVQVTFRTVFSITRLRSVWGVLAFSGGVYGACAAASSSMQAKAEVRSSRKQQQKERMNFQPSTIGVYVEDEFEMIVPRDPGHVSRSDFVCSRSCRVQSPNKTSPVYKLYIYCLLYTSPSPRDLSTSRMPSSA